MFRSSSKTAGDYESDLNWMPAQMVQPESEKSGDGHQFGIGG